MPEAVSKIVQLSVPFHKDSDVMADQDRQEILKICGDSSCDRIITTHGSGTMLDTGRLLADNLKDKTIVLTGSLPYSYDPVYAAFNLGNAVTACQLMQPGVYIATSGEVVSLDNDELRSFLPKGVRHWGSARRFLNIFLRGALYNRYTCEKYGLTRLESWLEVPLDSHVAKGFLIKPEGKDLPRWTTAVGLTREVSSAYQLVAREVAARRKLNAFTWVFSIGVAIISLIHHHTGHVKAPADSRVL
jgi:hypothetical protein